MEPTAESKSPRPKPLMQMDIKTEGAGKGPNHKRVRIYSTESLDDPRPFIVKDAKGNEVDLEPNDQFIAEKTIFGTASRETLQRLEEQGKPFKPRPRRQL